MKIDPICRVCSKSCKQVHPAIVVSCAKFIPTKINTENSEKMIG